MFAADDRNVDVTANLTRLRATGLADAIQVRVEVLEGLGHAMMNEETNWVDRDYLSRLTRWIRDL